ALRAASAGIGAAVGGIEHDDVECGSLGLGWRNGGVGRSRNWRAGLLRGLRRLGLRNKKWKAREQSYRRRNQTDSKEQAAVRNTHDRQNIKSAVDVAHRGRPSRRKRGGTAPSTSLFTSTGIASVRRGVRCDLLLAVRAVRE